MGMVAGVFLPFVLKVISAFEFDALLAATVVFTFVAVSAVPRVARIVPPIVACALVGLVVLGLTHPSTLCDVALVGRCDSGIRGSCFYLGCDSRVSVAAHRHRDRYPQLTGVCCLASKRLHAARNTLTTLCGIGSFAYAALGAVPTCVTGPANALLNASGEKRNRYVGGVVFGALMLGLACSRP